MATTKNTSAQQQHEKPKNLKTLLNKYQDNVFKLGGELPPVDPVRVKSFREDLAALQTGSSLYLRLIFGAVLLLLVVQVVLSVVNFSAFKQDPTLYKGIFSGTFGITCGGLIGKLIGLYKDKTRIEALLLLAGDANAETMQTIINVLAKKL